MKNIIRKFAKNTDAVAFVWVTIILCMFFVLFIYAATYDVIKSGMEFSRAEYPDDNLRQFFEIIYDYFPLWLILGMSLYGFAEAQRSDN